MGRQHTRCSHQRGAGAADGQGVTGGREAGQGFDPGYRGTALDRKRAAETAWVTLPAARLRRSGLPGWSPRKSSLDRHYRQRREDAVGGIQFQSYGAEEPAPAASQRTVPVKSDVSVPGNRPSMKKLD